MRRVTFLFKSGSKVQFDCEKLEVSTHKVTGGLMGYSAKGINGGMPIYARVDDIDCIYVEKIEEDSKLVYPEEIDD